MTFKTADSEMTFAPPTPSIARSTRPLPPVKVTLSDCDNEVPIRLVAGQALVIELTLDRATGYRWTFENMPAPHISVSSKKRQLGAGLLPDFGRGVETYHYTWSAEQVAAVGGDFVVSAVLARGSQRQSIKRTEFSIRVGGLAASWH